MLVQKKDDTLLYMATMLIFYSVGYLIFSSEKFFCLK